METLNNEELGEESQTPAKPVKKKSAGGRVLLFGVPLLWIVLLGVPLLLMGAVTLPCFSPATKTAQKNACVNNLRQIEGATEQWCLEKQIQPGTPLRQTEISAYIKGGWPTCPQGGVYTMVKVGSLPKCSMGHSL